MTPSSRLFTLVSAAALLLLTAQSAVTRGQTQGHTPVLLQITDADSAAQAIGASPSIHRPMPVAATAGANQTQSPIPNTGTPGAKRFASPNAPTVFPLDMTNPDGNPTVVTAQHHNIYVNQPPSYWGDPDTFLTDLGQSQFIHLVDQFVGSHTPNRYTLGTSFQVYRPAAVPGNTVGNGFLAAVVHAAAVQTGSGYGHIFHIYLQQGVDVCYSSSFCYSPDNPATMVFCAFHSAFFFPDAVGLALFTVEPYQNTAGCNAPPSGTPNGQAADSLYDSLAHEVFETITDPIPPTPGITTGSWISHNLNFSESELGNAGLEVADTCGRSVLLNGALYNANPNILLNGNWYSVQSIYSNQSHGCTYQFGDGVGP
jgi:hypothetical protein